MELQALLMCPAIGPCRGVEANCGDLATVFADTPLPEYPNGLMDWTCSAFPNDDVPRDSLIVGLLSFAIALPVSFFLSTCFELANDSEAPESWLLWAGLPRLVFGPQAHRKWHYTGPAGQPVRFVRWFCRSVDAPHLETLLNLWESAKAWATGDDTPWIIEADEVDAEARLLHAPSGSPRVDASECGSMDGHPVSVSHASAKRLRRSKRMLTAVGLGGVYLIWAFFAWVIFVRAQTPCPASLAPILTPLQRFDRPMAALCSNCWDRQHKTALQPASACRTALALRRSGRTSYIRWFKPSSSWSSWSACTSQTPSRGWKSTSTT